MEKYTRTILSGDRSASSSRRCTTLLTLLAFHPEKSQSLWIHKGFQFGNSRFLKRSTQGLLEKRRFRIQNIYLTTYKDNYNELAPF